MLNGPYYRVGGDLLAVDGMVAIHYHRETGHDAPYSYVCLWLPNNREILIRQRDHPQEYTQYLALYEAAPLLVSHVMARQGESTHE